MMFMEPSMDDSFWIRRPLTNGHYPVTLHLEASSCQQERAKPAFCRVQWHLQV